MNIKPGLVTKDGADAFVHV